MNTEKINLMDVMAVNRDAARKARKAATDKARRSARKAVERTSGQTTAIIESPVQAANALKTPKKAQRAVPSESPKTLGKKIVGIRAGAVSKARDRLRFRRRLRHDGPPLLCWQVRQG